MLHMSVGHGPVLSCGPNFVPVLNVNNNKTTRYVVSLPHILDIATGSCAKSRWGSKPDSHKRNTAHAAQPASASVGIFPAGKQQARVQLPALVLRLDATQVVSDSTTLDAVSTAVASGATAVVLGNTSGGGASLLYDAACRVKEVLRGRASLLLEDRTDIVQAVEADGVLLTDSGVPTVVARKMLADAAYLIGRQVASAEAAIEAAADGANLVVLTALNGSIASQRTLKAARSKQKSGKPIPVILNVGHVTTAEQLAEGWTPGPQFVDGLALELPQIPLASQVCSPGLADTPKQVAAILARLNNQKADVQASAAAAPAVTATRSRRAMFSDLDRSALLAKEKKLLSGCLAWLESVLPGAGELGLLRDSVKSLDEAFLVVVVGEFNSGKSSIINALLGQKWLAEGILPTTNEISILKHAADEGSQQDTVQADGLYVRQLPVPLLQNLNIVDTPGTNVILQRQQRLTEEYVPRADLVLFVMSADRPLTESEVRFLEYIRQWRKKVVFVVNKADILEDAQQVEEVKSFVTSNAQRILKLDNAAVLAVSARSALRAKEAAGGDDAALESNSLWQSSGYAELETYICNFLAGGSDASEGQRLKLQTPLFVADALLNAAARKLSAELSAATAELESVRLVARQLERFKKEMQRDGAAQREAQLKLVAEVNARAESFIDDSIQLSNVGTLASYITGGEGKFPLRDAFQSSVIGDSFDRLRSSVEEHAAWLNTNCDNQLRYYSALAEERKRALAEIGAWPAEEEDSNGDASSNGSSVHAASNAQAEFTDQSSNSDSSMSASSSSGSSASAAVSLVTSFNTRAVSSLLDVEVRDALLGTTGTAVGAPTVGLLAASYIPNALEDLLVFALASGAAYVAVLNMPLRRAEIKGKIARVSSNFLADVQSKMQQELEQKLDDSAKQILQLLEPVESAWSREVDRLESQLAECRSLTDKLNELQKQTASVE